MLSSYTAHRKTSINRAQQEHVPQSTDSVWQLKMSTELSTPQLRCQGSMCLMTESVSILSSVDFSSLFSLEWWLPSVDIASQRREDPGLFKLAISEMSQVCSSPYTQPFLYIHISGLPDSLSVLRSTGRLSPQRNSPANNLGVFFFSL